MKRKIAIYEPLDFKTAYKKFLIWVQGDGYKAIREIPADSPDRGSGSYIDDLVKGFLVETAYFYFLFEVNDLVEKFVTDISKRNGIPLSLSQDITLFAREKLESPNKLAAVKNNFREGSKLKTYFYTMTRFLVFDYGRKYNIKVESQDSFEMDKLRSAAPTPHLRREEQEIRERVERLAPPEKIAFKMYYYENLANFNAIARTLNTSRHKAAKILQQAVDNVLKAPRRGDPIEECAPPVAEGNNELPIINGFINIIMKRHIKMPKGDKNETL